MSNADEARRVAADMLRQAGDETGARVLELVPTLWGVGVAAFSGSPAGSNVEKSAWDVLASLDPAWAEAEVERAWDEALEMERVRRTYRIVRLREYHVDFPTQPALEAISRRAERLRPGELEALADPARLTYSAPVIPVDRTALLSATLETPAPEPRAWDGQRPVAHGGSPSVVEDGIDPRGEWDPDGLQD